MLGNGCDIWNKHSLIIVLGIFGSPEKDWLLVLKRTDYCRSYIHQSIDNHQAHHHHHHHHALDHHVELDTGFSVCCAEPHR